MRMLFEKSSARLMDTAMCAMMNRLQWRLRHDVCTLAEFESYLAAWESVSRTDYYQSPRAGLAVPDSSRNGALTLAWPSPVTSQFSENDHARALLFPGSRGWEGPTVFLLHALMSAHDAGYRRLAAWFNARGWNAIFPHLPFHYSRVPRGYRNGALAISAHLPRNGETLRQGVMEIRQLMTLMRSRGSREFGLIGTSYGGWTGALLSFVERDFRFISLIQPIVDVEHVIWTSPAAGSIRRILLAQGIRPGASLRHAHLTSPIHGTPLDPADRVRIIGGAYDTVAPSRLLRNLSEQWTGSSYTEVRQGHFGYAALAEARRQIEPLL